MGTHTFLGPSIFFNTSLATQIAPTSLPSNLVVKHFIIAHLLEDVIITPTFVLVSGFVVIVF